MRRRCGGEGIGRIRRIGRGGRSASSGCAPSAPDGNGPLREGTGRWVWPILPGGYLTRSQMGGMRPAASAPRTTGVMPAISQR